MMMIPILFVVCSSLYAAFDVHSIGFSCGDTQIIHAQIQAGPASDIITREDHTLRLYCGRTLNLHSTLTLMADTSVFDVADIDGDGTSEIIAVLGDKIMTYAFPKEDQPASPPVELFTAPSMLSESGRQPRSYGLVVRLEGRPFVVLPFEDRVELYAPGGPLETTFPMAPRDPEQPHEWGSFNVETRSTVPVGSPGSIERNVRRLLRGTPVLPDSLKPAVPLSRGMYWGIPFDHYPKEKWPWFPLKTTQETVPRALFAYKSPGNMETIVCITDEPPPDDASSEDYKLQAGKERVYSGQAFMNHYALPPDFNGDGYADLLLGNTSPPGTSVDALSRAVAVGSWNVVLTAHLYDPAKERHNPAPASSIHCPVSIARFISAQNFNVIPLTNVFMVDFDGDGRTDLACSLNDTSIALWLYHEKGFPREPSYSASFPEPIRSAYTFDFEENGRPDLCVRTESSYHIIRYHRE